jgi:[NiFe] hydrogenase diaphorase moiety large subunit
MMNKNISLIAKIRKAKLTGRGGAAFPVADKWEMVKKFKGAKKYVVCNGSEGEPGIEKDFFLLSKYPEIVIEGMECAIDYLEAEKGYIYLNPAYYKKIGDKLKTKLKGKKIELFKKPHTSGYIGGEETSALNTLEGKRTEPRIRPPYPPERGLWGMPTLVNNVETFYDVALVAKGKYEGIRFFSISGDCLWHGVYGFPEDYTIEQILKTTENYPSYDFFVQVGGGASGTILNSTQLATPVTGSGSIIVYSTTKHKPADLIKGWLKFFKMESCGQCTPCREGTYRLYEMITGKDINWQVFFEVLNTMSETSFCSLGCSVAIPIRSYIQNVVAKDKDNKIMMPLNVKKYICDCLESN